MDNLCPVYKKMLAECNKLKQEGKLHSFWTFNGTVFVKKEEGDKYGTALYHIDEVLGFPEAESDSNDLSKNSKNIDKIVI